MRPQTLEVFNGVLLVGGACYGSAVIFKIDGVVKSGSAVSTERAVDIVLLFFHYYFYYCSLLYV